MQGPLQHRAMSNNLPAVLEAILFYKGGSVSLRELEKAVGSGQNAVEEGLNELAKQLEGRGIRLVREGQSVALGTAPEVQAEIETARREELEGPLGRAGLETLAVIMYRGPLSRADIEYIRGVNASSILRSLLIRGLVERVDNPKDKRSFLYQATTELPAYLGVQSVKELPGYADVVAEIDAVFAERAAVPHEEPETHD